MINFIGMLGHGRALELFLALLKVGLGIWLVVPGNGIEVPVLADLVWYYPSTILALPFFGVGVIQFMGWILNITGYEISWVLRAIAAQLAVFMWLWLLFKTQFVGSGSPLFVVGLLSLPFSVLLLYKAWNRLPIPGSPGSR